MFIKRLKELIEHCSQDHNFGYTSSDFQLIDLSQKDLDLTFGNISYIESIYPLSPMQSGLLFSPFMLLILMPISYKVSLSLRERLTFRP